MWGDIPYAKANDAPRMAPLIRQDDLLQNFTRLQTFGSPNIHWVKVTVNPKTRALFTIQPMLVEGN